MASTPQSYHTLAGVSPHNYFIIPFTTCCMLSTCVAGEDVNPAIKELEAILLDCAKLDHEINYFVDTVKQVTEEVRPA